MKNVTITIEVGNKTSSRDHWDEIEDKDFNKITDLLNRL